MNALRPAVNLAPPSSTCLPFSPSVGAHLGAHAAEKGFRLAGGGRAAATALADGRAKCIIAPSSFLLLISIMARRGEDEEGSERASEAE